MTENSAVQLDCRLHVQSAFCSSIDNLNIKVRSSPWQVHLQWSYSCPEIQSICSPWCTSKLARLLRLKSVEINRLEFILSSNLNWNQIFKLKSKFKFEFENLNWKLSLNANSNWNLSLNGSERKEMNCLGVWRGYCESWKQSIGNQNFFFFTKQDRNTAYSDSWID